MSPYAMAGVLLFTASIAFALNETGSVQPVNIKQGEHTDYWSVEVSSTPVEVMAFDRFLGGLDCINHSKKYEIWIGSSSAISPMGSNAYPIERREKFYTYNGAAIWAVIESTETAKLYCRKEY